MDYNDYTVMQGITGRLQARGYDWDYDAVSEHMHTQVQATGHQYRQRQAELSQAQSALGGALNQRHQLQRSLQQLGKAIQSLDQLISTNQTIANQLERGAKHDFYSMLSQGLEDRQAALRGQISRLDDSSDPKVVESASSAAGFCVPMAMADGPLLIGEGACAVGMGIVVVSGIIGGLVAEDAVQILENLWYDYDRTSRQLEEVEKRLDGLVWGGFS